MHKLTAHKTYLFGLVLTLAVFCASAGDFFGTCGFKWGGG
jgi:hypothetical protein